MKAGRRHCRPSMETIFQISPPPLRSVKERTHIETHFDRTPSLPRNEMATATTCQSTAADLKVARFPTRRSTDGGP
jgi:hypothetical protein